MKAFCKNCLKVSLFDENLKKISLCKKANFWPGYGSGIGSGSAFF
jgi:hypothetical protein